MRSRNVPQVATPPKIRSFLAAVAAGMLGALSISGCSSRPESDDAQALTQWHKQWEKWLDFHAVAVEPSDGGMYFLVGSHPGTKPRQLVVAKISPLGEELWRRRHDFEPGWWTEDSTTSRTRAC
jgi:hypothetical protein